MNLGYQGRGGGGIGELGSLPCTPHVALFKNSVNSLKQPYFLDANAIQPSHAHAGLGGAGVFQVWLHIEPSPCVG